MRRWLYLWLLISGVISIVAVLCEEVLHVPLVQTAQSLITEPGVSAVLAVVILLGLDLFLPVPSSVVMILSGVMFGVIGGSLLSLLGTLAGTVAGFELARRYGRDLAQRLIGGGELDTMDRLFTRYGAVAIILSRPIPVMMETLSVVAGLSTMSRSTFVLATLLGTIPVCLLYAYAGAFSLQLQSIVPALLIGLCVPAIGWSIVQKWRRNSARCATYPPHSTSQSTH